MADFSTVIESLLYQSEGTALDFKQEQYLFVGATEEQKSELLKDILAFANAWRQGEAYIIIGVKTVHGGRHTVVGTDEHFDDAQLQQFTHGKTNRKVDLSYEIHLVEGKKIGVIRIPKQERPIYATRDYCKVKKELVYYRLGSSTAIAKPEDIARMGRDDALQRFLTATIDLQLADHEKRQELGKCTRVTSVVYKEPLRPLPDAGERSRGIGGIQLPVSFNEEVNRNFWREKEAYIRCVNLIKPLAFVIRNPADILAENVRVEVMGNSSQGIVIKEYLPSKPAYRHFDNLSLRVSKFRSPFQKGPRTEVMHHGGCWTLTVSFGDVQPKSRVWADDPFYIGSQNTEQVEMEAIIYADNLPNPQRTTLVIDFEVEQRTELSIATLKALP